MIQDNLALKLDEFEDSYCNLRLVDVCEQSLPDGKEKERLLQNRESEKIEEGKKNKRR